MSPGDRAQKIRVGKFTAGIVGLTKALSEAAAANLPPDDVAARSILEHLRKSNYVAPGAEAEYLDALLREYRKHLGIPVPEPPAEGVEVKVLGPGCPNCEKLEELVRKLMAREKIAGSLEHVRDSKEISSYGIFATPGLMINGRIRCAGRMPSEGHLLEWLQEAEREVRPARPGQVR
jgi:small redox-active disulfide protein 2